MSTSSGHPWQHAPTKANVCAGPILALVLAVSSGLAVMIYRLIALREQVPGHEAALEPMKVSQSARAEPAKLVHRASRNFIPENHDYYEVPRGPLEEVAEAPFWDLTAEEERAMHEHQVSTC
jgi:hypothetical protein